MIRVDASVQIGTGHVIRCLTLAVALRERHVEVRFVCRQLPGNLSATIASRGFAVHEIDSSESTAPADPVPPHAVWLGVTWQYDALRTGNVVAALGVKPRWLVVDHYGLDARWEQAMRPLANRLLAIDDIADRTHACDLLLDQNLAADMQTRYAVKVPPGCRQLLGPGFALLHPRYAQLHESRRQRTGKVRKVFVYFGGADPLNLTWLAVAACLELRAQIEVDVVTGTNHPGVDAIRKQIATAHNIRLHTQVPTLADLIACADLAVGAAGVTAWERICLGVPSLVVSVAENQRPVTTLLHSLGLIEWLGHAGEVDATTFQTAIQRILERGSLLDWSERCREICDGRGTDRVVDVMLEMN